MTRRFHRINDTVDRLTANVVVPYRRQVEVLPEKANPAYPDEIWEQIQSCGMLATGHLERLLMDTRFPKLPVKEQMTVISAALSRAYGMPDGAVKRNLHVHINPEDHKGFNAMTELARSAQHQLPEFHKSKMSPPVGTSEDQKPGNPPANDNSLNAKPSEDVSGDGN